MKIIPYGRQNINQADINAVVDVLKSDFLTQGPVVPRFEKRVAEYTGAKHSIAVNSATSALHIACLALEVGPGDYVWTSPITFVASANCALYCGASVDFVDIDPETYNMSVEALEQKLVEAQKHDKLPKVVIPVHLTGQSCDMAGIHALSKIYGFKIVEDASHAIGAKYLDKPVGACPFSDITVFSFHPVKIITTAEGGLATTNDDILAEKMRLLRSHGITRNSAEMSKAPDGPWYYEQIALGFNYRMTELQAALGLSQMDRLDEFVHRRHQIFRQYLENLTHPGLQLPLQHSDTYSSLHLFILRIKRPQASEARLALYKALQDASIAPNLHYMPVYLQPYYQKLGFVRGACPNAEAFYDEAISIPIYFDLLDDEVGYICKTILNEL